MNFNYLRLFISFMLALVFLNGCADGQFANKNFKSSDAISKGFFLPVIAAEMVVHHRRSAPGGQPAGTTEGSLKGF